MLIADAIDAVHGITGEVQFLRHTSIARQQQSVALEIHVEDLYTAKAERFNVHSLP